MKSIFVARMLATLAIFLSIVSMATAQQSSSCQREERPDPPRFVYRCANGLVLEAEAAAQLGIPQDAGRTRAASATVSDKAVLIEVEPGSGAFQILTPHAIAAVRGTAYVVDVTADTTSVFVIEGEVSVSLPDGSQTVVLGPGEGTDATAGQPLVSRVWGQERAARLMARFAR
ncbi:FecR domain-containing protein [Rhizobium sp. GN54]|uniref:FecR domain-containing protein n=1 Tax=Rhizobium sp. GN54 TaxID=2898150 RepID=UPI001E3AAEB4|nr:FecR domain-containing protein [Rhizobium sp. GN54]MCD2184666.1 FecR family protein [Rhizobium sp. GN54]